MAAKPAPSLAAFAKTFVLKPGMACWGCGIPEAEEIATAYRAGVRPVAIIAWLREVRGYASDVATANKVRGHLLSHIARKSA